MIAMAAGLKKDSVIILRMEGEDLLEFVNSSVFQTEMIQSLSEINGSHKNCVFMALDNLTVDHGMPPVSDSWVMSNIIEPALKWCNICDDDKEFCQETFLEEFKKVVERIAENLKEQPVIVAHSECIFDGSEIKRLLSNKSELDKMMDGAMKSLVTKEGISNVSRVCVAVDAMFMLVGLPRMRSVEMEKMVENVMNKLDDDDDDEDHEVNKKKKKMMIKVMNSLMLELERNPISVFTNSVVHESGLSVVSTNGDNE